MELYAAYVKERNGETLVILPENKGFYTYKTEKEGCLICDAYVKPEFRKTGIMRKVIQELAKKYKNVFTMSCVDSICWKDSHSAIKSLGFRVVKKQDNMLYYILEN